MSAIGALTLIAMDVFFALHGSTARYTYTKAYAILELVLVGLTVLLNLATTLLIVVRLWLAGRRINSVFYMPVIIMVVESGALYTVAMICYLIIALKGEVSDDLPSLLSSVYGDHSVLCTIRSLPAYT